MTTPLLNYGISTQRIIESMTRNENNARRAMKRLSTGLRVNSAADDPSGIALGRGHFQSRLSRIQAGIENLEQAIKFTDLRMDALMSSRDKILRMMDVAVRAANEVTLTATDLANMQLEIDGLNDALADNQHMAFRLNNNDITSKIMYNPGQLDVVWVIDQTGSMGGPIASVIAGAPLMFSTLVAKGFELRMGAVGYNAGAGAPLNPLAVPPGSPFGALSGSGSKSLQDSSAGFIADVTAISVLGGGAERGLDATMEALYNTGIDAQMNARPNAQRVFVLLTDADSDDNGDFGADAGFNTTAAQRDSVVNELNARSIKFYTVNSITEGGGPYPGLGQDQDYTDISTRTGGSSMNLDPASAWVTTISNTLQAFGGPWDLRFQWGPDSGDYLTHTVNTIMPTTLGTNGVNVTTAANAASSIDTIQSAMDFLGEALANTGSLRNLLQHQLETQLSEYTNMASMTSNLLDADLAEEISNFARTSILQDAGVATLTHNLQGTSLMSLIDSNLTTKASSGIASVSGLVKGEQA